MTKLQLAHSIFSEPQFSEIIRLNQETIATLLKVSQPLISRAKANSQFHNHIADISDGGRPSLISPEGREKLLQ
jgi:predicted XRE-type DNA-binding protein